MGRKYQHYINMSMSTSQQIDTTSSYISALWMLKESWSTTAAN